MNIEELTNIVSGFISFVTLVGVFFIYQQTVKNLNSNKSLVKEDIRQLYYKALARGYFTELEWENFKALYNSYVMMGGNSYIHSLYEYCTKNIEVKKETAEE